MRDFFRGWQHTQSLHRSIVFIKQDAPAALFISYCMLYITALIYSPVDFGKQWRPWRQSPGKRKCGTAPAPSCPRNASVPLPTWRGARGAGNDAWNSEWSGTKRQQMPSFIPPVIFALFSGVINALLDATPLSRRISITRTRKQHLEASRLLKSL